MHNGGSSVKAKTAGEGEMSTFFPMKLFRSEMVPPSANRRESSVDWIEDFGGASWIAYGAGPLLVVSHLSSPLSKSEENTEAISFFRQVIELPALVNAVSWCPSVPSHGEIAVAAGNSIWVYSPVSDQANPGSFRWKQSESIVENFKIEAITWTGSGDALLAAGSEVVLWIRKKPSWEVAWRSTPQVPQNFISATHLSHGPIATASLSPVNKLAPPQSVNSQNSVLVYLSDDKFGLTKLELGHPHGVSMIQWRPYLQKGPSKLRREILLTCSLDGTARLWSECNTNKPKGTHDIKNKSFHVIAVVEINNFLHGTLGGDISLKWAVETESSRTVVTRDETGSYVLSESVNDSDQVGKCEWLVSTGPHSSVGFWAVHCLDDLSPVRYPRVTLWKKQQLENNNNNNNHELSVLLKPIVSRNSLSGPPVTCSLVQFSRNNEISHSSLFTPESGDVHDKEMYLSRISFGIINHDGHEGNIKLVCFDPYSRDETELSVSLDSENSLRFWSISNLNLHVPSNPIWNLLGKIDLKCEYSCLTWAPLIHDQNRFVLLGSENRIDCFVVKIPSENESLKFVNIFTIPFGDFKKGNGSPDKIYTVPLDSNNNFLVFCVWKNMFNISSWQITLDYKTQNINDDISHEEVSFDGKVYYPTINPGPNNHDHEKITCFDIISPNNSIFSNKGSNVYNPSYHMVTGCSEGTIKIWKINNSEKNWKLVGSFVANKGPIDAVSFSNCGTKIATCSSISGQSGNSTIRIWEPVCLPGGSSGIFQLEQAINLQSSIINLNWVSLGNGQLLLGVSLQNELLLYCQRRPEGNLVNTDCFWDCFAKYDSYYEIKEFLWGPKLTPVLVHDKHLSVFSQWLNKSSYESDLTRGKYDNLIDLADKLGGSLPSYHPRALIQYLYSGKWKRARAILEHLIQSVKTGGNSNKVPEMKLSDYFIENTPTSSSNNTGLQWGSTMNNQFDYMGGITGNQNSTTITSQKSDITELKDIFDKTEYSDISETEKIQILAIGDILSEISDPTCSSPYKNLDESGRKFWVSVQFQRHLFARKQIEKIHVNSGLIAWAFQSECKDDLLNSTLSSEPTWLEMRDLGLGYWYNDVTQLRAKMEKLARMQYLKKRDPKECALLYIALNRIQVLAGLFKISKDEKDKPLFAFLCRNFQEEKNKGAALKNAYVLMGRHQLDLAIAFFLLGGDVSSAITICAKNYGDGQLALVICQLIQGFAGPLERDLISNVLLPNSIENRDFWLSSLLEWKLGNYSKSVERLFENHDEFGGVNRGLLDPQVGQYCAVLASKNSFKNSVGEIISLKLSKFCASSSASALDRYGLPIEAMECLESKDHNETTNTKDSNEFYRLVNSSADVAASNWISVDAAYHIFSKFKHSIASKYLSKFLSDHLDDNSSCTESKIGELKHDLETALSLFETKFFLDPLDLIETVSLFVCNNGLLFLSYRLFGTNESSENESSRSSLEWFIKEICYFITRYIISRGFIDSALNLDNQNPSKEELYLSSLRTKFTILKSLFKNETNTILDLIEYLIEFAFAWLVKDKRGLIILINPILNPNLENGLMDALNKKTNQESQEVEFQIIPNKEILNSISILSDEEKWTIITACLWIHFSEFSTNHLEKKNLAERENKFAGLLINALNSARSLFIKQVAWFINQKLSNGSNSNALTWLQQSSSLNQNRNVEEMDYSKLPINCDVESLTNLLWELCVRPKDIFTGFVNQKVNFFSNPSKKNLSSWKDINMDDISETKHDDNNNKTYFQNPIELIKRQGELLEAICFNSINNNQLATASNKKGLVFFNSPRQQNQDDKYYVWSESDWPVNGYAGSESTPMPTCVSPGVGLGSNKRGAHLGLGGATIGELTGGSAFGIPGYAAISSLGWGEDAEFEQLVDPPATIQTVHSCALSNHPSLPLFLAGSSNTHVYLWEFGKEKALATYGVLPSPNIPPPYSLASISAVRFDSCGHRFATSASNGTVCTWQVEVGGRSNVSPVDSSLCFNSHASDVEYLSASGSVVAAAGYSTNNVNVVVWDTLAPPASCQASLLCHEGGARSVAIFEKEIGSGSISPLIITGGKNGDVGLHDFRFIGTGKTKRDSKHTRQNSSGMIWYLPKAHLGSITRIASIPNTSMFLTGSKDGDVKLWDASKSQMIFHWPKLHDRHTFFQPNSRGFGGVVRAAVTDIQVLSNGFLTCGGDGSVKLIHLK